MEVRFSRPGVLITGMVLAFAAVAGILAAIVPGPLGKTDYLVIGTLGTFAALVVLFLVALRGTRKDPER